MVLSQKKGNVVLCADVVAECVCGDEWKCVSLTIMNHSPSHIIRALRMLRVHEVNP